MNARVVAQSEWRLAPIATSRLSIRCWTRSRSSTLSETMSSLRRRQQNDRMDVPLPVSFARSGAARSIPGAIYHSRRARPTKTAGPTSRTPCRRCAKRSSRTILERRGQLRRRYTAARVRLRPSSFRPVLPPRAPCSRPELPPRAPALSSRPELPPCCS